MSESDATIAGERAPGERGASARSATSQVGSRDGGDSRRGEITLPAAHLVQSYEDDELLVAAVATFLADGIRAGDSLVVIATEPHREAFRSRLESAGIDVASVRDSGRLTLLDAHETLSSFMRDGAPDRELFEHSVGGIVSGLAANLSGTARLRAYGEMADVLWGAEQRKAALHLEELWNDLQGKHATTLLLAKERAHREEVEATLRESLKELRAREEALRQSERQLRLVTAALPVRVSFVDAEQRFQFVSAAYERWLDRPRSEILGRHLEEVIGRDAYRAIRPHVERALSGTAATFQAELTYPDGGARSIEATYTPQPRDDGSVSGFVGLVADVTERRSLERFQAAAAARAERLFKITAAIADAVSSEQVFEAVVDHVAAAVGSSSAALWLFDEGGKTATLARSLGYSEEARRRFAAVPLDASPSIPALDSIRLCEPIWIASQAELLARYPHLGGVATPGRAYRVSCLPLVAHGRVVGALGLTIEEARESSAEERDFLLLVARYASQAVDRLRLFEAERRLRAEADAAATRMGVLSHASGAFVETDLGLGSRLEGIVSCLGTALASCIGISLIEADGLLHTSALYHPVPEAHEALAALGRAFPLRKGEGVAGAVAATGRSVLIPTIEPEEMSAHAPPAYRAFLERHPAYAMICAPLRARGRVFGTVSATRVHKGEAYTTDDLRLLEELAERAAAAIENSRLYQETLDARARAEQLYRFAQAVVAADRVESVYDAALAAIEAALGSDRAAVLTFGDEEAMRFRAWRNLSDAYRSAVEGHSPWPRDATAPEPVLVPDAERDPAMAPYLPLLRREGIGALAFIPLVTGGRLLGKFMFYYDRPRAFALHEVETARAIANHLASVMSRFAAVARIKETIRSNELFAGVLAHDLRNPLGAMMAAAQLALVRREGEGARGDGEVKPLGRILSSGQRMTTMIDQLLDFTRARSGGGIEVEPHEANLADLCAQAAGELELAHPDWTIRRETLGDPRGTWDSDRLLQVLSNLVANAGQHGSPEAGILLRLDGTDRDRVGVEVHNGGAIPGPLLPHIFNPFRNTRHRRGQSRGLGLGLFIVREIVRAHGGTVEISSSEAAGTTFSIRLPRHGARAPGRAVAG